MSKEFLMKRFIIIIFLFNLGVWGLYAQSVSISQIDSSQLLLQQTIQLYLSITDRWGASIEDINQESLKVYESADGENYKEIESILGIRPQANTTEGINFLLLVDNSGSMYYGLGGESTEDESRLRITQAKEAILNFLSDITNPKDKVGLISYNTYFTVHSAPTEDREKIKELLDKIEKPEGDEIYTELYASLYLATQQFQSIQGRKVIILLTDGQNDPYFLNEQKEHRDFGEKIFNHREGIDACQEEGVSVFVINFRTQADENMGTISKETGGRLFNAKDRIELEGVYSTIQKQVLSEIKLTYLATMDPAEQKYVKVEYEGIESGPRYYFSSTIFGLPLKELPLFLLIPLILGLLLWILLFFLKIEKKKGLPQLGVLKSDYGKVTTKVLTLEQKKTVIGSDAGANLTIVGAPQVKQQHATIVFDKGAYTIAAEGNLTVNNKPVKNKKLEAGDVINVGGTTIVFDDGKV
jgi:Ca-activated chloride channel family protein